MNPTVLFLGPLPEPVSGHSLACKVLLDEMLRHGRVEVIDLNKRGFKQGVDSLERVTQVLGILWRVWRKRNSCDVIYLTIAESVAGNLKDLAIYLICFRRLDRMVIHLHGGAGIREILISRGGWLAALNNFFLKRLAAAIVLGSRHVEIFAGRVPQSRIHIVPNFAQDHLFTDTARIDAKFSDTSPLRILFLSNPLPGKGHLELVEAFAALSEPERARLRIDFAGQFESEAQQQDFLRRISPHEQLIYHGIVRGDAKTELLARAHVFCLPTYYPYEGQPISILEAYASGCAVITTDHSGIPDIFEDGVNGLKVAKRSATELRQALARALESPQNLHRMALNNLNAAQQRYRASRYTHDVRTVIAGVCGAGSHA